jgi:hypothetical protein
MVLSQLDLRTLTDFRRVSQRATEVIESIPQYKEVSKHARNVLRGILSIETGRWITFETLYDKLCAAECEQCGDFGGCLYILTCKLVCFLCFSEDGKYLPLLHSHAIRKFGISRQNLDQLPGMRSIPGTYSPNEKKGRGRLALVDSESALCAGIALHGSSSAMEQYVSDMAQKLREYSERVLRAAVEGAGSVTLRLRQPQTEGLFDGRFGKSDAFHGNQLCSMDKQSLPGAGVGL